MKKKNIEIETYNPEIDKEFMGKLLDEWDAEAKGSKVNAVKRINAVEEKVAETWNSYQELTVRLDKLTLTLNLNRGKMAVFAATSLALGKSYFGANNNSDSSDYDGSGGVDEVMDLNGLSYFVSIVKLEE